MTGLRTIRLSVTPPPAPPSLDHVRQQAKRDGWEFLRQTNENGHPWAMFTAVVENTLLTFTYSPAISGFWMRYTRDGSDACVGGVQQLNPIEAYQKLRVEGTNATI